MPEALYDILILIEEKNNYDQLSTKSVGNQRLYYFNIRNRVDDLIGHLSEMLYLDPSMTDSSFYTNMLYYYFHSDKEKISKDNNLQAMEKIEYNAKNLDSLQKKELHNIKTDPLFIKVMGVHTIKDIDDTLKQFPNLKSVFGASDKFDVALAGSDLEELRDTFDGWYGNLESILENGMISEQLYDYFNRSLDYLYSYYHSILKGEQRQLEESLNSKTLSSDETSEFYDKYNYADLPTAVREEYLSEEDKFEKTLDKYGIDALDEENVERLKREFTDSSFVDNNEEFEKVEKHRRM